MRNKVFFCLWSKISFLKDSTNQTSRLSAREKLSADDGTSVTPSPPLEVANRGNCSGEKNVSNLADRTALEMAPEVLPDEEMNELEEGGR